MDEPRTSVRRARERTTRDSSRRLSSRESCPSYGRRKSSIARDYLHNHPRTLIEVGLPSKRSINVRRIVDSRVHALFRGRENVIDISRHCGASYMPPVDAVRAMLDSFVRNGELAGAATLTWRDGRVVQSAATGWRDMAAGLPIERNTIFRIASLSKPITSVVALTLFEQGRFALDEPISHRWAPEFAEMQVLRDPNGALDETDPAARPITFEDLLTHRSGLTYGDFHSGPLGAAYAKALGGAIDSEVTPDAWIAGLARLPLIDQPGAAFHYGCSTVLLGLLIARIEGAPLGDVLAARIFDPLGLEDTGFTVPRAKRHRRSVAYGFDAGGRLAALEAVPGGAALP